MHAIIKSPKIPAVYISIDIEADGPIPGPYSMLSLGAVQIDNQSNRFSVNIKPLATASTHPDTMAWWTQNAEAYKAATTGALPPSHAMDLFFQWLKKLSGKPVAVCYPASFDFMFVYWYMIVFKGECPFGFSAFDMKTAASALLKIPFRQVTKRNMPREWTKTGLPHTHVAVEDAVEQAVMAQRMCSYLWEPE
jgi:hypothetical protein